MDDVGNFEDLVQQGDVTVREVNGCTSSGSEVVDGSDAGGDDEIVDDFTIDLSDHLIGHEVGEGTFSVDVVDRLEVLCSFQGPGGLQLAGYRADGITVNRQGDFGLEGVVFQVVLVINSGECILRNGAAGEGYGKFTSVVIESSQSCGGLVNNHVWAVRATADEDDVGVTIGIEGNLDAGFWLFTIIGVSEVDIDYYGTCKYGLVEQGATEASAACCDGEIFTFDGLGAVVRIQCPTILPCKLLGSVLAHDLGTCNRLAFVNGVTVADVEDEAGRLAHWLYANEVVCNESGE